MGSPAIDYDSLAKQNGATSSAPAAVDYDALAKQNGALSSQQPSAAARVRSGFLDTTVRPVIQAISHPIDTLTALGRQAIGKDDLDAVASAVKSGDYEGAALHLGKWALGRTPEGASLQTGYSLLSPTIQAAQKGDIPTVAGRALGTAAMVGAGPATGAASDAIDALSDSWAGNLMRSALKGGYTVNTPAGDVGAAANLMREQGVTLTPAGQAKISQALMDLRQSIQGKVNDAAASGITIDPRAVADRLDELRSQRVTQVDPVQDLKDIDKVRQNFMDQHTVTRPATPGQQPVIGMTGKVLQPGVPATPASTTVVTIPADEAQAIKVGSNMYNADKYGKLSPATIEAEKSLTRGLKEELEAQIPELRYLNTKQADLMNLDDILGKAVNKYINSSGFTADLKTTGIPSAALRAIIANPLVKSRIAAAIDMAREAHPGRFATGGATGLGMLDGLIAGLNPQPPQQ